MSTVIFPVRVMAKLGVKDLISTRNLNFIARILKDFFPGSYECRWIAKSKYTSWNEQVLPLTLQSIG